jgi:hypothetical protein
MNGLEQQERGLLKVTDVIAEGLRCIASVTGSVPNKWR